MRIIVAVGIASQRCSSLHRLPCWHLSGLLSFMSVTVHVGALTLTLQLLYLPFPSPNCSCNFCDPFRPERPHYGPVVTIPVARLNYFCYRLCCSMPYAFVWIKWPSLWHLMGMVYLIIHYSVLAVHWSFTILYYMPTAFRALCRMKTAMIPALRRTQSFITIFPGKLVVTWCFAYSAHLEKYV